MTKKPGYPRWLLNKDEPADKVDALVPCPQRCAICGDDERGNYHRSWSTYFMHVGHRHGIYNMVNDLATPPNSDKQQLDCPVCHFTIKQRNDEWLIGYHYLLHAVLCGSLEQHIEALKVVHFLCR